MQIEAQLNSRPLLLNPITDQVLTPGHFLIGHQLNMLPEPSFSEISMTNRYKIQQRMQQEFWKRWNTEYLNELQQRKKWKTQSPNIKQGQLVLIKEDNTPPATWPKGVVETVIPGKDGLIRVVEVRDAKGNITKRPLAKIIILPTEESIATALSPNTSKIITRSKTIIPRINMLVNNCQTCILDAEPSDIPKYLLSLTLLLKIVDDTGREKYVKALWDTGAMVSCITTSFRNTLKMNEENVCKMDVSFLGIQSKEPLIAKEEIRVSLMPHSSQTKFTVNLIVMDVDLGMYPQLQLTNFATPYSLADPFFYCPMQVHIVLGQGTISRMQITGSAEPPQNFVKERGYPHVNHTKLGNIINGWMNVDKMANKGRESATKRYQFPTDEGAEKFLYDAEARDSESWTEMQEIAAGENRLAIRELKLRTNSYWRCLKKTNENFWMYLPTALTVMFLIGSCFVKSAQSLNITTLDGPGFLMSHDKTLMIKTGQFNFRLISNTNVSQDMDRVQTVMDNMTIFCKYLDTREYPKHECQTFAKNINNQGQQLLEQLQFRKNYRGKRSEGLIMWLIHLVIGDDSYDHDKDASKTTAKRTTVLVQHALENFKHLENQLTALEKVLEDNQRNLSDQLDKVTKTDTLLTLIKTNVLVVSSSSDLEWRTLINFN